MKYQEFAEEMKGKGYETAISDSFLIGYRPVEYDALSDYYKKVKETLPF